MGGAEFERMDTHYLHIDEDGQIDEAQFALVVASEPIST